MNLCAMFPYRKKRFLIAAGICKKAFPGFAFSFFLSAASAQKPKADTTADRFTAGYQQYMAAVGGGANLYNGAEYVGSYPQTEGTPFWNSNDFIKGVISYEGVVYRDVPIAYDLVKNEVVIKGFQQLAMRLYAPKIDFFSLAGHQFVHPPTGNDSVLKNAIPDGLYDLLYEGTVSLYAQRTKSVAPSFHAENPYLFVTRNTYFLLKDGEYYSLSGKKELLDIFKAGGGALKSFWKEENVNFKSNPEGAILQTVMYWDKAKKLK